MKDQNPTTHESPSSRMTRKRTPYYSSQPTQTHTQSHFLERVRRVKVDTSNIDFQNILEETLGTLTIQGNFLRKLAAKENKFSGFGPLEKKAMNEDGVELDWGKAELERVRREAEEALKILHSAPKT